jgi:SPP1 Gp6-like portal protein
MAATLPALLDTDAYTSEWWRDVLSARLEARLRFVRLCDAYYDGDHQLGLGTPLWDSAFQAVFRNFSDNWMALIVDSSVERLRVQGFRYGTDQPADEEAWAIWQANQLDLYSRIAHTEAIKIGEAFLLVAPPDPDVDEHARITVEHPAQCIVARDPADRRRRLAGLKRWETDDGRWYVTLYLPDSIYRWQSRSTIVQRAQFSGGLGAPDDWEPRDDGEFFTNPLGVVPLIPLENNPTLLGGGRSDIAPLIALQDAINKTVCDALIASEYSSLRQRWATGIEVPKDSEGNVPANYAVEATFKRLWISENPDARWGEFSVSDLSGYVTLTSMLTQHLAALSRTPPHYLLGQIVNASGDALKTAEATLVAKVRAKMVDFSEPWEEAVRCAFLVQGDTERGQVTDAEVIWADPESRTESEHADAIVKQQAVGVPQQMLWEQLGYSPQQTERMRQMQAEEAMLAGAALFTAPPTDQGVPATPPAATPPDTVAP